MVSKHSTSIFNATSDDLWVEINKSKILVKVGNCAKFPTDFGEMKVEFGNSKSSLNFEVKHEKINQLQLNASHNSYIIKEENGKFNFVEAMYGTTSQENGKGVKALAKLKEEVKW